MCASPERYIHLTQALENDERLFLVAEHEKEQQKHTITFGYKTNGAQKHDGDFKQLYLANT